MGYLKQWTEGVNIAIIDVEDMSVITAFSSCVKDHSALIIVKKLFEYVTELQAIPEGSDNPEIERLLRHMQRCILLIDLWYAGEDITYFGTMLDLR